MNAASMATGKMRIIRMVRFVRVQTALMLRVIRADLSLGLDRTLTRIILSKKKVIFGLNSVLSSDYTTQRNTSIAEVSYYYIGPLIDDGAVYSEVGGVELKLLHTRNRSEDYEFEPKPNELYQFKYWKYGSGAHSSSKV